MLAAMQLRKHARIYFIFGIFAYIYIYIYIFVIIIYAIICWKVYLFTCLNSIVGEFVHGRCYENT